MEQRMLSAFRSLPLWVQKRELELLEIVAAAHDRKSIEVKALAIPAEGPDS